MSCDFNDFEVFYYCNEKGKNPPCEHVNDDWSCGLGSNCWDEEGGKLNTPEANERIRLICSYLGYEILRTLAQFGACQTNGADEIRRALNELKDLIDVHIYEDSKSGKLWTFLKGNNKEEYYLGIKDENVKQLVW